MIGLETYVPGTAAVHLIRTRASTGTPDELTLVWSTRPVHCEPGAVGHLTRSWPAGDPPFVWDSTWCGDWQTGDGAQCPACGSYIGPRYRRVHGHRAGRELRALAEIVADEVAEAEVAVVARVQARLLDDLAEWEGMTDGERADSGLRGDETHPGIFWDGDRWVAWDWDPYDPTATIEV